jgi:hypothetical protein
MTAEVMTPLAAPPHEFASQEQILLGDLRELLEEDPTHPETRRALVAALDVFVDMLPCQFALEEHEGYLEDVRMEFPEWEGTIESLHQQHQELDRRLCELRDRLAADAHLAAVDAGMLAELRNWLELFRAHRQAEDDLLQAADLESITRGVPIRARTPAPPRVPRFWGANETVS